MMVAARTFETLANFYQTTLRYNPEDSHLRAHRRENLKSYSQYFVLKLLQSMSFPYYERHQSIKELPLFRAQPSTGSEMKP
jgi:hypothetical protein